MRFLTAAFASTALLFALALGTSSCARTPSPELPEPEAAVAEEVEEAAEVAEEVTEEVEPEGPDPMEVEITRGMSRAEVEELLGEPTHVGQDRQGRTHCLYSIGEYWRSVLYDRRGRAVEWHP